MPDRTVACVVIGRNEGERLVRCLASITSQHDGLVVYVDSNSTDDSVANAHAAGAEVVNLDLSIPFTAARARNAGVALAIEIEPALAFINFVDGDCEIAPGWMSHAHAAMLAEPDIAALSGHLRERFPQATFWNGLADLEWRGPVGDIAAVGGNAFIRRKAFDDVGGYREDLIAGEEPEMCFRMRQKGWRIVRIDAEMCLHDANMTRFGQWWKRASRAGHAFAEGAALHGASKERYRVRETRSGLVWGALIPSVILLGAVLVTPWMLALLLLYPAQIVRLKTKGRLWREAAFLVLAKFPEALGALRFHFGRLTGRRRGLIEYK